MITIPGNRRFLDRVTFQPVRKSLTNNTATDLFTIILPDGEWAGGTLHGICRTIDASANVQVLPVMMTFSAVRKSTTTLGVLALAANTTATLSVLAASSTLAFTPGFTDGGSGNATFRVTFNSSLTTPTVVFDYILVPMRGTPIYL